jgi:hypothetical protein
MIQYHTQHKVNHRRYSLGWWLAGARNFFWLAVVTLMIWVYADLEISEPREFTATLRLVINGEDVTTALIGANDTTVTFEAIGRRGDLTRFERWLTDNGRLLTLDITDYSPGDYVRPTTQLLNENVDISRHGLDVLAATPNEIHFRVDALETRTVPIRFDSIGASLREGQTTYDPATVDVTAPTSAWAAIDKIQPDPVIMTEKEELAGGLSRRNTRRVKLLPRIGDQSVILSVNEVTVTFVIERSEVEATRTVRVDVKLPPSWLEDGTFDAYALEVEGENPWQQDIRIAAPTDRELAGLADSQIDAFLSLTEADKGDSDAYQQRRITVRIPPESGVRLSVDPPMIRFRLVRRQPATDFSVSE